MPPALFHRLLLSLPGVEERLIGRVKEACQTRDVALLKRCLDRGLHPNTVVPIGEGNRRRATLLGLAARECFPEGIEVLLERGALVDGTIPDSDCGSEAWADGKTPLALLTYFRESDSQWEPIPGWAEVEKSARLLLRAGADPDLASWSVSWRGSEVATRGPENWSTVREKIEQLMPFEKKAWLTWVSQEVAYRHAKERSDSLEAALPVAEPVVGKPRARF